MLYVYHGTDIAKSIQKARSLIDSLRAKRPDATYIEVVADSWSPTVVEENIGGQGLFSSKYIVFLNRVSEKADAKDELPDLASMMHESTNIFVVLEGKLNAELKKAVEKHADKAVESDEASVKSGFGAKGGKGEFNIFALADAVGSRNALKSWTLYRQAIDSGLEPENIIGVLFWKMKSLISAKNAGVYSEKESKDLLMDLVTIYHDGHRGLTDTESALEKRMLDLRS